MEGGKTELHYPKPTTVQIPKMALFRASTSARCENNVTCRRWMMDLG
jgi:hypothetical protein